MDSTNTPGERDLEQQQHPFGIYRPIGGGQVRRNVLTICHQWLVVLLLVSNRESLPLIGQSGNLYLKLRQEKTGLTAKTS